MTARAKRARVALTAYRKIKGTDKSESLTDLLADLMHLAGRKLFDKALASAIAHYEAES